MQVLTAPGVMIHEIDKSQYSPAMQNTACYVMGFANKGEAYQPMEFTSRTAWLSYYGEPDNEAERYFYNAACEVLNQGGRLYCARLPYDNLAFQKMVGVKYKVNEFVAISSENSRPFGDYSFNELIEGDKELLSAFKITGGLTPTLYDLSTINLYRDDEEKVGQNTFVIVDTTGATYGKVVEDYRTGIKREVIGIVPIVTTAANALYAQKMINVELSNLSSYEVLSENNLNTLVVTDSDNNVIVEDEQELSNQGFLGSDSTTLITTKDTIVEINYRIDSRLIEGDELPTTISTEQLAYEYITDQLSDQIETFETNTLGVGSYTAVNPHTIVINKNDQTGRPDTYYYTQQFYVTLTSSTWSTVDGDTTVPNTLALDAANYFTTIQPSTDGEGFDPEYLKDIGVVVYRAYLDPTEGNKVSFEAVEAFCGSLYKDAKDPNTGVSKFIDTIINSQSKYINFFSNCFSFGENKKKFLNDCDILIAQPSKGAMLGLYSPMTNEDISITKSILQGMKTCFDKVSDINQLNIDIVPDAGISNIASYLKALQLEKGPYDLGIVDEMGNSMLGLWKCTKATDASVKMWKTVVQELNNFCKNIRKDCMFITECPRPLVLTGQKKVVRPTKPDTNIDTNILPYLKAVTGLNTNYGAGYLDWFEVADEYTGDFFWLPPSIKAMGVYLYTDANYYYWDAPAGLNRGIVAATDVAFSPNGAQAGAIYEKSWNYAINYPNDGIVLEGQKTF